MADAVDLSNVTVEDRIVGAIMGTLIGDAMGMGVHWYYNLEQLKKDYGWVEGYVDPKEGMYHHGYLKAGDLTQSGELTSYLLRTLAEKQEYDKKHFTDQWDQLLSKLDGTRKGGEHGWTNKDMVDNWRRRVVNKKEWGPETASPSCDTTDSIIRAALIAARYHKDLPKMCEVIRQDSMMQYGDQGVVTQSICFGCMIAAIINGEPLNPNLSATLYRAAQDGNLPFSFSRGDRDEEEGLAEPDGLLLIGKVMKAATDERTGGRIEEAHLGVQLYGQACAWYMVMPSAYFIVGRYPTQFQEALLASVNAGGQNVARSSVVAALLGAHVGIQHIPARFIERLSAGSEFLSMAKQVAAAAAAE